MAVLLDFGIEKALPALVELILYPALHSKVFHLGSTDPVSCIIAGVPTP
jgi:hypothetical protein